MNTGRIPTFPLSEISIPFTSHKRFVRVDNRIGQLRVIPDKTLSDFLRCNQETYDILEKFPHFLKKAKLNLFSRVRF